MRLRGLRRGLWSEWLGLLMGKAWFLFFSFLELVVRWMCVAERTDWVCVCVFLYHSNENYSALPVLFVAIRRGDVLCSDYEMGIGKC